MAVQGRASEAWVAVQGRASEAWVAVQGRASEAWVAVQGRAGRGEEDELGAVFVLLPGVVCRAGRGSRMAAWLAASA